MKYFVSTIASILVYVCIAQAQQPEIFAPNGKAIRGYDPVAFFKEGKPVPGADSLSLTWKGVQWHFASRNNLDSFTLKPEQYAPQYGGYCAFGTARGYKAPTEVDTWTVVNGKLYFNYNMKVKASWEKDQSSFIEKANKNWPQLKDH